jgi:hypothetical protein
MNYKGDVRTQPCTLHLAATGALVATPQFSAVELSRAAFCLAAFEPQLVHEPYDMTPMKLRVAMSVNHSGHTFRRPYVVAEATGRCAIEQALYQSFSFLSAQHRRPSRGKANFQRLFATCLQCFPPTHYRTGSGTNYPAHLIEGIPFLE